jgi:uncharacterized protein
MNKSFLYLLIVLMLGIGGGIVRAEPLEDARTAVRRGDYATALGLTRPLAERGNAEAQYRLGNLYFEGKGVSEDYSEAAKWFRLAAEQEYAWAQLTLGIMYEQGLGFTRDYLRAYMWYNLAEKHFDYGDHLVGKERRTGIEKHLTPAQISQAQQMAKKCEESIYKYCGEPVGNQSSVGDAFLAYKRGDYSTALRISRPLADQGDAEAQIRMGIMCLEGKGVSQDFKEAVKWFRLAANQGNAEAQSFLGSIYHDGGKGVPQDYREAAKWYRLAAQQDHADSQEALGDIFYDGGIGVTQDYKEAAKWYGLAANHGSAEAQLRLGYMNYHGQGVTQDYKEAVKWYRIAAQMGRNADAQFFLGNMYHDGKGVAQDYREAVKWHRLAALRGMARAQLSLGIQYYGGREGVAQDYQYAYMWLSLAASKLDGVLGEAAARSRNGAAKEMTSAQILEAQEMAKQCEGSNYKECEKPESIQASSSVTSIPMKSANGTYVIPVLINDTITLDFVVDSGASDVSIPADVVTTLMRTGTLKQSDFLDQKTYKLADGSTVPSQTFRLRSLKVGSKVIENVSGSVTSVKGTLLLGQSFLNRFRSWSVDNSKHALVLE